MATEITKYKTESIAELQEWGKFAVQSGVLKPGTNAMQAMAIIQTGKELGLAPMQSLRSMFFVNGQLSLSTQLMLALARRDYGVVVEEMKDEPGQCTVTLKRGEERITTIYTMEMAKKAKLDGKPPWVAHPEQMLRYRALSSNLKIIAPDSNFNLLTTEEAEDIDGSFALDPGAAISPDAPKAVPAPDPFEKIGMRERTAISQAMKANGWVVKGSMTSTAIEKLGSLGYENSAQIPMREYENVLRAFSEPAPVEAEAV